MSLDISWAFSDDVLGGSCFFIKGPLTSPSDPFGVIYIDISKGIDAAGELIRKEVAMPSDEDKLKIEELERRCKRLQEQLDKIKVEQTNYLQNVSHQLVAPLNAIKWHIENLTAGRIANIERAKKVLRSVYSQSTIAVHLAKNFALMEISRKITR